MVALKALLVGLLLLAVLRPDLPEFEGKAMTGRAIGYPIAAAIVPISLPYGQLLVYKRDPLGDLAAERYGPLVAAALEDAGLLLQR
jgi:hypothetical protein